jgi:RNA polymerase sigma factor (sigma-70 family)
VAEPEATASDHEWTEKTAIRLDVEAAVRQLGPADQEFIDLRYNQGLTHSTIANLMSIPVGTCKVRLHRARKRLHGLLAEEVAA